MAGWMREGSHGCCLATRPARRRGAAQLQSAVLVLTRWPDTTWLRCSLCCITPAVVTPEGAPQSSWIRVYCPLGMADLFGAHDE
jgi:hypothetical protein